MDRITCGQCEHGPTAGMKKKKCIWSGDMRGQGALACKAHFASSVDSDLRCVRCKGPFKMNEVVLGEKYCTKCKLSTEPTLSIVIILWLFISGAVGALLSYAFDTLKWW